MKEQNISKIITTLEQVKHIQSEQLCNGLCTPMMMLKIESGERIPGKMLLDAILQRLGESPNKLEMLISWEDYEALCQRMEVEEQILEENYTQAKQLLEKYQPEPEKAESVERQWIFKQKYYLEKGTSGDFDIYISYLEQALAETVPEWKRMQDNQAILSTEEISLFLLLLQEYSEGNREKDVKRFLRYLIEYIEVHFTDEEERLKVYPKAVVLYAECYPEEKQDKKVISYCEQALQLVTHNNALYYLLELLDICMERLSRAGRKQEVRHYQRQRDSLAAVYDEYGYGKSQNKREIQSRKREYQLYQEVIKSERVAHALSQEDMIEGIYSSPETLSRVENGKTAPHGRKLDLIMKKLDIDISKYNARLSVDDYGIYELEREFVLCEKGTQYDKAREIYNRIAMSIGQENNTNRQWLIYMKAILDLAENIIDAKTALARYLEAIEITYKYQEHGIYRVPMKKEAEILNNIAKTYFVSGEREKALDLHQKLVAVYKESKMNVIYHGASYSLLLSNYVLEEGNTEKTEGIVQLCDEGILLLLSIGMGDFLGKYQLIKGCTYELIDKNNSEESHRELSDKYIVQAAYLCDLFQSYKNRDQIRQYYNDHYDGDHDWD